MTTPSTSLSGLGRYATEPAQVQLHEGIEVMPVKQSRSRAVGCRTRLPFVVSWARNICKVILTGEQGVVSNHSGGVVTTTNSAFDRVSSRLGPDSAGGKCRMNLAPFPHSQFSLMFAQQFFLQSGTDLRRGGNWGRFRTSCTYVPGPGRTLKTSPYPGSAPLGWEKTARADYFPLIRCCPVLPSGLSARS